LSKKLYVGNHPFSATEDELRTVFEQHGSVASVNVITDRETGRPRGFAFVEKRKPEFWKLRESAAEKQRELMQEYEREAEDKKKP